MWASAHSSFHQKDTNQWQYAIQQAEGPKPSPHDRDHPAPPGVLPPVRGAGSSPWPAACLGTLKSCLFCCLDCLDQCTAPHHRAPQTAGSSAREWTSCISFLLCPLRLKTEVKLNKKPAIPVIRCIIESMVRLFSLARLFHDHGAAMSPKQRSMHHGTISIRQMQS